jgi:hypothetical protein
MTTSSPSKSIRASAALGGAAALGAAPAAAHGFGQRYDLPLPLSLYLFGAASAVLVSFVIVALFVRRVPHRDAYPHLALRAPGRGRQLIACVARLVGLALFGVTLVAGFRGDSNPYRNIAPTLVWVIGWVGLVYVSAFVGDVWTMLNPWDTVFAGGERVWRWVTGRAATALRRYPERLGMWPAVALLLGASWVELVYPDPAVPLDIAWLIAGYSLLTWAGMVVFGRAAWREHGELFGVLFGTFARFALVAPRAAELRPFGAGLLDSRTVSTSMTGFVLLVLATVLYDGILGAPEWTPVEAALGVGLGIDSAIALRTIGLAASWLIVLGAYLGASALMSAVVAGALPPLAMARQFALTLVPIAIGYDLAHYLTFLLIQGQYIVPLVSDPFGFGWDLFGTAGYRVDIAVVGARFAWYVAVSAILIGHIAAVYLAHRKAMVLLPARGAALRSQVPLTALMVVYTFVSLSILAEPMVERRAAALPSTGAAVAVPDDALRPEPGTGLLQQVGPGRHAAQRLRYRMLTAAFHDGTRTTRADLLYALSFAFRWGVRGAAPDATYDPAVDQATAPLRRALVALKIVGADTVSKSFRVGDVEFVRELLLVDVYLDAPALDAEQDAAIAPPWSTVPWHVLALMEEAVQRGWAAFSAAEAARRGVPWLDLVRDDALKPRLAELVAQFARDGYRPAVLAALVTPEAARRRWEALGAFYREHHHFLVANGPYKLKAWSSDRATVEAFRDLSYPLGVGSYDHYAIPRRGFITAIARDGERFTLSVEVEMVEKLQRDYRIVRETLRLPDPFRRRILPECRYLVTDEAGRVLLAGTAPPPEQSKFQIDLAGKLAPGRYTLAAEIALNGNTMNAEIKRIPLVIGEGG